MTDRAFSDMNMKERMGFDPSELKLEPEAVFDFEAMRNDPAMYYIQLAIRSGLDPEDLNEDEKEFLQLVFGVDDWKEELLISIETMPEMAPEGNKEDAIKAMNSLLEKARSN
jgi:hypothetical protein